MSYEINYDDQKFKDVETDKKKAISDLEKTYSGMINDSDAYYKAQVDATKEWEKKQTELQNQQTDFAIKEIEQNKAEAKKDYTKEQSGAYQDWKKQSDQYGVRAEQIADQGMQNTGYSESSQVSMYNTYQNRVSTARESYLRIVQDFDNAITQARLQNNSALAEIAYNSLQQRLELNLQGFQYKNTLLLEQANRKTELEQMYHERWQDVLNQMNTENALAEEIRQYNESMDWEKYQFNYHNKLGEFAGSGGGGGGGGSSSSYTKKVRLEDDDTGETYYNYDQVTKMGYGESGEEVFNNAVNNGLITTSSKTVGNDTYVTYRPSSTLQKQYNLYKQLG